MKFKKINGTEVDLVEYTNNYLEDNRDVEIAVGTDSQTEGKFTTFCTVVAFYHPGHGAHCIFRKWKTPRFKQYEMDRRLMKEVEASIDVAQEIKNNCWDEPKYIDIDVNPLESSKSNIIFQAAVGYVVGMGYRCRFKTLGPLVTSFADWIVKS